MPKKELTEEQKKKKAENQKAYRARKKAEKEKAKQEQAAMDAAKEAVSDAAHAGEFQGRPMVDDAEAAFGDDIKEAAISATIARYYFKSQVWAGIMYRDSAPPNWEDVLRMLGVPFAVSPLHNKDLTQAGVPKKDHWHVMLYWPGGSTTYKTAAAIMRDVLHGTIPIPLAAPRGYYRYFCHLDNPNKAKYEEKDIITGNGFDIGDFLGLTAEEKCNLRKRLLIEVMTQGMTEYWELVTYAMYNMQAAEFDFVCTNTLFFVHALKSKRFMELGGTDARGRLGKPYPDPVPRG